MNTIHDFLVGRHPWYQGWHQRAESNTFHWMIFLMFTLAATASMVTQVTHTKRAIAAVPQEAAVVTIKRDAAPAPMTQVAPLVVDGVVVDPATGAPWAQEEMVPAEEEMRVVDIDGEVIIEPDVSEETLEVN